MIQLTDVSKIYYLGKEKVEALGKINLTIQEGEFVAIVGPSGSGKSTLLHLIGALDKPTSGKIEVFGHDLNNFSDLEASRYRNQTIGFVFQNFNLIPSLTALDNTSLPLLYRETKTGKMKDSARESLNIVGLEHRKNHKPTEVSGGESQRIAIARSIVNHPKIILADEPTGNLDTKNGRQIINLLKNLNREGLTLIIITHNEDIAKEANRIIKMQDGKII